MGSSVSVKDEVVNSNHEGFTVNINHFNVEQPQYEALKPEFRNRFSLAVFNQLLWSINEALLSYKNNADYEQWKSAFGAIYGLKLSVIIICLIPFGVSLISFITCIFLIFISLFLTATGVDHSWYIWTGTYNMLSTEAQIIVIGCYIVTFIGLIILYFTQRSLKPLKKAYTINIAKYISINLNILSHIYNKNASFDMKWIKCDKKIWNCSGLQLSAHIDMNILREIVDPIEDEIVMDSFNLNNIVDSSQSNDLEDHDLVGNNLYSPYDYAGGGRNRGESYGYYPVEGPIEDEGDIQTDISIEILVDDIDAFD